MDRPFYPHEADDPDLDWLISNFLFERPDYYPVESGMLPLMLIPISAEYALEAGGAYDVAFPDDDLDLEDLEDLD